MNALASTRATGASLTCFADGAEQPLHRRATHPLRHALSFPELQCPAPQLHPPQPTPHPVKQHRRVDTILSVLSGIVLETRPAIGSTGACPIAVPACCAVRIPIFVPRTKRERWRDPCDRPTETDFLRKLL